MINKKMWAFICLAGGLLVSCQNTQTPKNDDNKIDSLVTRTRGEIWGFIKTDRSPAEHDIKFITKRIYTVNTLTHGADTNQQWLNTVNTAKGDGQQIYLNEIFDEWSVKQLINSVNRQTATIKNMIASLKSRSASGIVLNFGDVAAENVLGYLKFIKKLTDELHSEKLAVAIVTSPRNSFNDKEIGELTEAIDYIIFNFDADYNFENKVSNPYVEGRLNVIATMRKILLAPINLGKVILLLPYEDRFFTDNCEFSAHVGLAGVAVNYTGKKEEDVKLTDSLKAKFQYVDTVKVSR